MGEGGVPPLLLPQTARLEDTYIVGILIGRGSYSMVYKSLYKGKKERACKVYEKTRLQTNLVPYHVERLLKLSHPHLISVHDVFETDWKLQVVTDLASGEELLERIERSEHYSEREAAIAVSTVLSVLEYLHSQDVHHGAVFPENLLYESEAANAKLKLSEIVMPKRCQSPSTLPVYSVSNCEKELITTEIKCSADIWSLGILIYIMLCGSEPTLEELMVQVSGDSKGPLSEVSASARNLITGLVQIEQSERLTVSQALSHPWVCGSTVATCHMVDAQERLRTFNARRKLRATTHAIIATQRAMSIVKPFRNCQATR